MQGLPSLMMPSGMRPSSDPAQMLGMPEGALFRSAAAGEGQIPDAHERNAMIGHTLSAVDALLVGLR